MSGPDDQPPKDSEEGAEVVPIDGARKRSEEKVAAAAETEAKSASSAAFLQPVMAAIARELSTLAGPDGVVRVGGEDEASRARTAAVVRGLGAGIGAALAEAFGKWAQKIEHPAPPDEPSPQGDGTDGPKPKT